MTYKKKGVDLDYRDVLSNPTFMKELLDHSRGKRLVPIIIEGGEVQIGFEGRT